MFSKDRALVTAVKTGCGMQVEFCKQILGKEENNTVSSNELSGGSKAQQRAGIAMLSNLFKSRSHQ